MIRQIAIAACAALLTAVSPAGFRLRETPDPSLNEDSSIQKT